MPVRKLGPYAGCVRAFAAENVTKVKRCGKRLPLLWREGERRRRARVAADCVSAAAMPTLGVHAANRTQGTPLATVSHLRMSGLRSAGAGIGPVLATVPRSMSRESGFRRAWRWV